MNKLILIKINVNMKQIESIKVGVSGEILSAEVKTIKTVSAEQFCQIYLRDNEEFYKLSKAEIAKTKTPVANATGVSLCVIYFLSIGITAVVSHNHCPQDKLAAVEASA